MICPICFGRKYDFKKDGNSGYFVECKKCHGTGIVESLTNEEWLCGLSTEEKAKRIINIAVNSDCDYRTIVEWLKQPHTPQKQDDYPCNVKGCSLETQQACCGCPDYFEWEKQHKE